MNTEARPGKEHFRYLDSLRGLAALSVVLVHSTVISRQSGFLFDIGFNEQRGVQLFYFISAFTLCHSFAVRQEERRPLLNYFLRRFFRIAPLFYLAVAGNLLLHGLGPHDNDPIGLTPRGLFLGLFFLNGWDPESIHRVAMGGWSIADETIFYLVLPVILATVRTFRQSLVLLLISTALAPVISGLAYNYFQVPRWSEYFFYLWFPVELPIFCLGISTYFFWREYYRTRPNWPRRKAVSLGLIFASVVLFFINMFTVRGALYPPCFAFAPLVLGLSLHEWPALVNPVTVFLGRISYSIYLGQFFFILVMERAWPALEQRAGWSLDATLPGLLLVFACLLLLTLPLALITYYFVEKPGIRLGRWLIQRYEKRSVPERL
jgi:peptidoglycan/LPS O-acetylase OafA/YrhL